MTEERGSTPRCNEALQNMYLFLDSELPSDKRAHVQKHLDDCIPCLEAFEFEAELKTVIRSRCRDDVPEHLFTKIRQSLRVEIQGADPTSANTSGNSPSGGIPNA